MKKIFFLVPILFTVISCEQFMSDNYEVKKMDNKLIRLNKKTGEIVIIKNNNIIKIDGEVIMEGEVSSKVKSFTKYNFPESNDLMTYNLKIKWRNNNLLYIFTLSPFDKKVEDAFRDNIYDYFYIKLYDKDDFEIRRINIPLKSLERVMSHDTKEKYSGWKYTGTVILDEDMFNDINTIHNKWLFSDKLRFALNTFLARLEKGMKGQENEGQKMNFRSQLFQRLDN